MTNKQATDIAAQIGAGVEVREHPQCRNRALPFCYAVCGQRGCDPLTLDAVRKEVVRMGAGYCIEQTPKWAAGAEWAVY